MTVTLILIVSLLAFFLGWILRQSFNVRPWVAGADSVDSFDRVPMPRVFTTPRVGLIVFLAAISSMFALLISAYSGRMHMAADWGSLPVPVILWLNTAMLILASIAFHASWRAASDGNARQLRAGLVVAGILSAGFVLGQLMAWRILHAEGHYLASNPATSFFYLITALHGVHMVGGLIAWFVALRRVLGRASPVNAAQTVELCAIYWHYLLAVWLVLFGLILYT